MYNISNIHKYVLINIVNDNINKLSIFSNCLKIVLFWYVIVVKNKKIKIF